MLHGVWEGLKDGPHVRPEVPVQRWVRVLVEVRLGSKVLHDLQGQEDALRPVPRLPEPLDAMDHRSLRSRVAEVVRRVVRLFLREERDRPARRASSRDRIRKVRCNVNVVLAQEQVFTTLQGQVDATACVPPVLRAARRVAVAFHHVHGIPSTLNELRERDGQLVRPLRARDNGDRQAFTTVRMSAFRVAVPRLMPRSIANARSSAIVHDSSGAAAGGSQISTTPRACHNSARPESMTTSSPTDRLGPLGCGHRFLNRKRTRVTRRAPT